MAGACIAGRGVALMACAFACDPRAKFHTSGGPRRRPCLGKGRGSADFAWEPALPGDAYLRTFLRALFVLGTLLGNGSWDLAWEPLPGNRTCNRVLRNKPCLGSSATPGTRFPIKFSGFRFASKVTRNDSQARFPRTCSQARFPSKGSRNSCQARVPETVAKQGSQARNRFPSKVPRNRFPRKGCKKGFQE